jgi:hypothetical protein
VVRSRGGGVGVKEKRQVSFPSTPKSMWIRNVATRYSLTKIIFEVFDKKE